MVLTTPACRHRGFATAPAGAGDAGAWRAPARWRCWTPRRTGGRSTSARVSCRGHAAALVGIGHRRMRAATARTPDAVAALDAAAFGAARRFLFADILARPGSPRSPSPAAACWPAAAACLPCRPAGRHRRGAGARPAQAHAGAPRRPGDPGRAAALAAGSPANSPPAASSATAPIPAWRWGAGRRSAMPPGCSPPLVRSSADDRFRPDSRRRAAPRHRRSRRTRWRSMPSAGSTRAASAR